MNQISADFFIRSREVFVSAGAVTLADVRARVAVAAAGTVRRDTLSALDSLARFLGRPLETIRANRKHVRELLASMTGPSLGVSAKRYANVCSLVATAVRDHGEPVAAVTKRIPLAAGWRALLDRVAISTRRMALYRLACFCSAMGVAPDEIGPETLRGFHAALEAEEVVKHPRKLLKHAIAHWNMCRKAVAGWPDIVLRSPLAPKPYTFALAEFPPSFRADVAEWTTRVSSPDRFDPAAPARPLKPTTIKGYIMIIRRFASALVHRGELRLDQMTGFAVFFAPERFKSGLRFFLERLNGEPTVGLAAMAADLRNIAKYYVRVDPATLTELIRISERLGKTRRYQMTERNRERLRQFDNPENITKLLAFPETERARARRQKSLIRRIKCLERALAVDLLIHCCLRMQNLRSIRTDTDLHWTGERCFLSIDSARVKNEQALEFELPPTVAAALQDYIANHRPHLPGADGPYLFPGERGGARSHNALAHCLKETLFKRLGLVMNPHLFRHAIAKIVVERSPDLYAAMSRHLGHKRLDTTMANYLGTETRAAGRHINKLLKVAKTQPALPKD